MPKLAHFELHDEFEPMTFEKIRRGQNDEESRDTRKRGKPLRRVLARQKLEQRGLDASGD
jgi:hypothetical protein